MTTLFPHSQSNLCLNQSHQCPVSQSPSSIFCELWNLRPFRHKDMMILLLLLLLLLLVRCVSLAACWQSEWASAGWTASLVKVQRFSLLCHWRSSSFASSVVCCAAPELARLMWTHSIEDSITPGNTELLLLICYRLGNLGRTQKCVCLFVLYRVEVFYSLSFSSFHLVFYRPQ